MRKQLVLCILLVTIGILVIWQPGGSALWIHAESMLEAATLPAWRPLPAATPTPAPEPAAGEEWIVVDGTRRSAGTYTTFYGRSSLPDGTCLHTLLLADGEPLRRWPVETCVAVQQGTWQVPASLSGGDIPGRSSWDPVYELHIWYGRRPSAAYATFALDPDVDVVNR